MSQKNSQARQLLHLMFPVVGTQFSQMVMGFVDTLMSGHASATDLAAVAVGSSIWIPLILFFAGILTAITPTVAHFRGARETSRIGYCIRQSVWIGLVLGLLGFTLLYTTYDLFVFMQVDKTILPIANQYLQAIAWGMPAITGFFILRYLNEGIANILPIMLIGLLGLFCNIICNYLLIFGHFGAPQLGGVGAGWATTISHWLMFFVLLIYIFKSRKFRAMQLFSLDLQPHWQTLKSLIKLGLPIGIAFFVEGSVFSIIALFLASMGVVTVAAHQIALNFSSLIFIIPLSLSISLTIQVGQNLGARHIKNARATIQAGYLISLTISIVSAIFIFSLAENIAAFYTHNPQVIELAASLMLFTALYQFSDGIQLVSSGALRGMKDTAIPMLLSILSYWVIGFPLGYILALTDWVATPMGAKGFWIGLLTGLSISAVLMSLRVYTRPQIR